MIKSIYNHLLAAHEFYTLTKSILSAIETAAIDEQVKNTIISRLKDNFSTFESTIYQSRKNPLTKEVKRCATQRKDLFLGFRNSIKANTYHWDSQKRNASQQLETIIRRHGWTMHRSGYSTQSASINAMTAEMQKKPAVSWIKTAETEEWLYKLVEAQEAFETAFYKREALNAMDKPIISKSRKLVYDDLTKTLNYLTGQREFNGCDAINSLINTINKIITGITTTAKARHTRRFSKAEMN